MHRPRLDPYLARDILWTIRQILYALVGAMLVVLFVWLVLLWLAFLPFRVAMRYRLGPKSEGVRLAELTALASLATAGVALLRSSRPAPVARKAWKKEYRALMARRPDDNIPF